MANFEQYIQRGRRSLRRESRDELSSRLVRFATGRRSAQGVRLSKVLVLVAAFEFAAIVLACGLTSITYYRVALMRWPPVGEYLLAALFVAAWVVGDSVRTWQFTDASTQQRRRYLLDGAGAVTVAFSLLLSTMFLFKVTDDYSRGTFVFQFIVVSIGLPGLRVVVQRQLHTAIAAGRLEVRRVLVIGNPADCRRFRARFSGSGFHVGPSFPFPSNAIVHAIPAPAANAEPKDKEVQIILEAARALRVDDILVLPDAAELASFPRLAAILSELPVRLHILPCSVDGLLGSAQVAHFGPVSTIQLFEPPLSVPDQVLKRAFDLAVAATLLIVLLPFLIIISIAIKLDSRGPIFYRQTRHGYNNKTFRIFKFRTMSATDDDAAFLQAARGDKRVTRIGHFLRARNIDELPQLLNVLLGQMSIVGPRPHPLRLNERFGNQISRFYRRHNLKPGITGWAQVNGYRGETDTLQKMQKRVEFDLFYINNWSLMFDIKILVMTLFSKSAYVNAY
jgi:Undecaprenyl-phosphate glucose phosphotransferase